MEKNSNWLMQKLPEKVRRQSIFSARLKKGSTDKLQWYKHPTKTRNEFNSEVILSHTEKIEQTNQQTNESTEVNSRLHVNIVGVELLCEFEEVCLLKGGYVSYFKP